VRRLLFEFVSPAFSQQSSTLGFIRGLKNKHDLKVLVRLFAQNLSFSAQFEQQMTLSRFDNTGGSDNIRHNAT
jgi:hypothetical protein